MAKAPCCSDKAAALMVSAGLATGRSVVKSTSCRLLCLALRVPTAPELAQGIAVGSSQQGGGDGRE